MRRPPIPIEAGEHAARLGRDGVDQADWRSSAAFVHNHSDIDCTAQGLEGYVLKAFAQGRVSMNRCGDILKPCAHLERQAESRRQFRYGRADGLNSDQKIIIGANNHANEARFIFQR